MINKNTQTLNLEDLFSFQLMRLSNVLALGASRYYTTRFNIGLTEWRVLATIARYAPISAQEVSKRTGVDKGWVSRAVNSLLSRHWIIREPNPEDGRILKLTLTTEGIAVHQEGISAATKRQKRLLTNVSITEQQLLMDLLIRLHQQAVIMLEEQESLDKQGG
ncbi:MarR family winged helix-turn-helix transcriptional regulator [Beggiatoa leptomitoformis]|uniref:MarR family transcriptional regulator n=1 Tax=Beggiatoa leptomitoformis TaxID=288004 RepID=A0A2N9YIK5_9GAMM|nr:MarR family transcriptional regulator [Beggiatoa leptomitoformis]ALG67574.1 MarR family transcriptional regulator [Beggiatoa leptomitoformis]AUI70195.1 MarR family transcriptional regulator [Beggiatoa leptomitoformis]